MRELTMDELMFVSGGEGNACDKVSAELNVVAATSAALAAGSAAMGFQPGVAGFSFGALVAGFASAVANALSQLGYCDPAPAKTATNDEGSEIASADFGGAVFCGSGGCG